MGAAAYGSWINVAFQGEKNKEVHPSSGSEVILPLKLLLSGSVKYDVIFYF